MNIAVSGAVLSTLFYEHSINENDLEGLLLGEITNKSTDTISDSEITNVKQQTTCNIYNFIPCRKPMLWYDNVGVVDADKLKHLLTDAKHQEVIGWFKFRRNSSLVTSMRERAIHTHLIDCFPGVLPGNFLYFLCTSSHSTNMSTHSMDHVCQVLNGSSFRSLSMSITNLGDSVSPYQVDPVSSVSSKHGQYNQIVNKHKHEFVSRSGVCSSVGAIQHLNSTIHQHLQTLCATVCESEKELDQLRQDVKRLKAQLKPDTPALTGTPPDSNPFRDAVENTDTYPAGPESRQLPPTNPFYSSLPGSSKPHREVAPPYSSSKPHRDLDDVPPPYTELYDNTNDTGKTYNEHDDKDMYRRETNPFVTPQQTLAPLEPDLICFGESDEENIGKKKEKESERPSSTLDTMDTDEEEVSPSLNYSVNWSKSNNSSNEGKFDFIGDLMKNSGKTTSKKSGKTEVPTTRATRSRGVKGLQEAIELSSDEDDPMTSGSTQHTMSGSPVF